MQSEYLQRATCRSHSISVRTPCKQSFLRTCTACGSARQNRMFHPLHPPSTRALRMHALLEPHAAASSSSRKETSLCHRCIWIKNKKPNRRETEAGWREWATHGARTGRHREARGKRQPFKCIEGKLPVKCRTSPLSL